jgi:hypothetical protein
MLTKDTVSDKIVNFILYYMQEKHYIEHNIEKLVQIDGKIFVFPSNFYQKLCFNNPLIK